MDEIAFSDATSLVARIKSKEISSLELLEHYLARVDKYNKQVNAIVATQVEEATARAKAADAALAKGEDWGPLHGLPMTVKESFNVKGMPTTWGDPSYENNLASEDAVAVKRLQDAGAVIFGKTNVPIHLADFQSYNAIYGTTNNPHNLGCTPGGSSGGAAAALAAGLTGLEMGSDIGGSIRNPAHYCGVFGHKPTWGTLPIRGHSLEDDTTAPDISVIGPLGRSAEDLKLAMDVVGGADEIHQPGWTLAFGEDKKANLSDYKVAVWANDEIAPVDASVEQRVLDIATLVADAGGSVNYDSRPKFDVAESHKRYTHLLHAALSVRQSDEMFELNLQRLQNLKPDDNSQLAEVTRASTLYFKDWYSFNENRNKMRWSWHEYFKDVDILLAPVCMTSAFKHDHNPRLSQRMIDVNGTSVNYFSQVFWSGLTGVSYLPSTVIPTGLDKNGLPIGVQIIGREMGDLNTIEFARKIAEKIGGFIPPAVFQD
ncbi:MAG: amidase [Candidatus Azotimanducaceae bacterium]